MSDQPFFFSFVFNKGNDEEKDKLAPRVYAAFKIITTVINFKYPHEAVSYTHLTLPTKLEV